MKSTTGLPMALAIFLLVPDLIQSLPVTATKSASENSPLCNPQKLIEVFIEPLLNCSLVLYQERANGNLTNSWSEHVLEIPSEKLPDAEKTKAAFCGMDFMLEVLAFILNNHTSDAISTDSELRCQLNSTLELLGPGNLQGCMSSILGRQQCTTPTKLKEPVSFYKKKLWGCRVFQDSLKFVNWLKNWELLQASVGQSSHSTQGIGNHSLQRTNKLNQKTKTSLSHIGEQQIYGELKM